jgi:hypothetical protein
MTNTTDDVRRLRVTSPAERDQINVWAAAIEDLAEYLEEDDARRAALHLAGFTTNPWYLITRGCPGDNLDAITESVPEDVLRALPKDVYGVAVAADPRPVS